MEQSKVDQKKEEEEAMKKLKELEAKYSNKKLMQDMYKKYSPTEE